MLAGLEREGLVERVPCTRDRRVVHVDLTDDGRERCSPSAPRASAPGRDLRLAERGRAPRRPRACSSGSPTRVEGLR
jgi:DNA-binding MarR family transcriptional regulator